MRTCKYCGRAITWRLGDFGANMHWMTIVTPVSPICTKSPWHAPHDVPESLEREDVERWLEEPLVID